MFNDSIGKFVCFLYILAAVSSSYNEEIGGLRTKVEALNQEIADLNKHTVPTTTAMPTTSEVAVTTTTVLVPTTTVPTTTVNQTST